MATGENEMAQQQALNTSMEEVDANATVIEMDRKTNDTAQSATVNESNEQKEEEYKDEMDNKPKPDANTSNNDGLFFELQSQIKSMQMRMDEMEQLIKKTKDDETKQNTANDVQAEDPNANMSRWESLIHTVGLIIFKFVTFLHLLHAFIGRSIIRRLRQKIQNDPSTISTLLPWIKLCIFFNASLYLIFPGLILFCLLWSPFNIYNEIQSWMIAYCVWAFCVFVYWIIVAIELGKIAGSIVKKINKVLWIVVGISLPREKQADKGYLCIMLASLIPSALAGFVSNFILEEKFILDCDQVDVTNHQTVCTIEGQCCLIVSSHKLSNIYQFGGTLVSNIIGTFAVIRIMAWLMAKGDKELMAVAERKK